MASVSPLPLGSRSIHRPVKTCTECKQVKLRCDSKAKFPAPCSRCQTRNLQCTVDSTFRRTPARRRVEEMTRELEALRQRKDETEYKRTASPSTSDTQFDSPEVQPELNSAATVSDSGMKEVYHLESFTISWQDVVEIYRIFALLYHPHFPILTPDFQISAIHDDSPFLFWTIIAVVLGRFLEEQHAPMHEQLHEPYNALLQSEILQAPMPGHTIQALCILITWPLPKERQINDASWLYCGIAVNTAMHMGLHHAKPMQNLRSLYAGSHSPRNRALTWLGCFSASTSTSMHVGVSPSINSATDLSVIEHFVRTFALPVEFAYQVMVHHTLAKFTNVIIESALEGIISHSLVRLIDNELDTLKTRFPAPYSPRIEAAVLIAKIHLYTMTIIRASVDLTTRRVLMRNGFSVALRIVYLHDQGLSTKPAEYAHFPGHVLQRSIPKNSFRSLALAAIFLLRFFALNIHAAPEEQEIARNHVAVAQRYLKAGSRMPDDEMGKGASLLERLSRQKMLDGENTKLRVEERMSASLMYDAVTTGQELRCLNGEKEEGSVEAERNIKLKQHPQPQQQQSVPSLNVMSATPQHVVPEMHNSRLYQNGHLRNEGLSKGEVPMLAHDMSISDIDMNCADPFAGTLNFSLPEDLWGDSVWSMFGSVEPGQHFQ